MCDALFTAALVPVGVDVHHLMLILLVTLLLVEMLNDQLFSSGWKRVNKTKDASVIEIIDQ